jgi:hypothetical protein
MGRCSHGHRRGADGRTASWRISAVLRGNAPFSVIVGFSPGTFCCSQIDERIDVEAHGRCGSSGTRSRVGHDVRYRGARSPSGRGGWHVTVSMRRRHDTGLIDDSPGKGWLSEAPFRDASERRRRRLISIGKVQLADCRG